MKEICKGLNFVNDDNDYLPSLEWVPIHQRRNIWSCFGQPVLVEMLSYLRCFPRNFADVHWHWHRRRHRRLRRHRYRAVGALICHLSYVGCLQVTAPNKGCKWESLCNTSQAPKRLLAEWKVGQWHRNGIRHQGIEQFWYKTWKKEILFFLKRKHSNYKFFLVNFNNKLVVQHIDLNRGNWK